MERCRSRRDSAAERGLLSLQQEANRKASQAATIMDQLVIAADLKPRKFRTQWQQAGCEGPAARKDAESAERDRWIARFAEVDQHTDGEIDPRKPK